MQAPPAYPGGVADASAKSKRAARRLMPSVTMATRAAVAAMAAWLAGNLLPGEVAHYAYAAPLGAFIATGSTVFTVARAAMQQAAGLAIGAALGVGLLQLDIPAPVKVGIIGGVGVLAQAITRLGTGASSVPVAALLVVWRRRGLDSSGRGDRRALPARRRARRAGVGRARDRLLAAGDARADRRLPTCGRRSQAAAAAPSRNCRSRKPPKSQIAGATEDARYRPRIGATSSPRSSRIHTCPVARFSACVAKR